MPFAIQRLRDKILLSFCAALYFFYTRVFCLNVLLFSLHLGTSTDKETLKGLTIGCDVADS